MASNFFSRYMWLIDTIQRSGHITLEDLDKAWRRSHINVDGSPLSKRTFFNHKQAILDQFGIDIKYVKPSGYYISNEDDLGSDGLRNWMLTSIAANSTVQESVGMRNRIIVEDIPEGLQYLNPIIDAMKGGQVLSISYQRFEDVQANNFEIEPYCIKLFHQRWYVLGMRNGASRPALYSLDRIKELKPAKKKFRLPRKFDAKAFFDEYFGVVIDDTPVTPVRLKVWDPHRQYIRALPLQSSQKEVETQEKWSIFEYRMASTYDLAMELMKYYDMIEVLEPETLRDDIIDKAYCILDLYGEHTPGSDFVE